MVGWGAAELEELLELEVLLEEVGLGVGVDDLSVQNTVEREEPRLRIRAPQEQAKPSTTIVEVTTSPL